MKKFPPLADLPETIQKAIEEHKVNKPMETQAVADLLTGLAGILSCRPLPRYVFINSDDLVVRASIQQHEINVRISAEKIKDCTIHTEIMCYDCGWSGSMSDCDISTPNEGEQIYKCPRPRCSEVLAIVGVSERRKAWYDGSCDVYNDET